MNMPIFFDTNTPKPFIDPNVDLHRGKFPEDASELWSLTSEYPVWTRVPIWTISRATDVKNAALPDHIYMDAMGFGMGCCCLQITFQACSVSEARRMYDALVPVGPIMASFFLLRFFPSRIPCSFRPIQLALTAAAPIFRGLLADVDCRWDVIAGSVDDRTPEERGLTVCSLASSLGLPITIPLNFPRPPQPLKNDRFVIPKSRYDSVDCYIHDDPTNRPEYNDTDMPIDEAIKQKMMDDGVDARLASHFAHLFIRDPLVIFEETLVQDDDKDSDHFEVRSTCPSIGFRFVLRETLNLAPCRTSNRPTGRRSASSLHPPILRSAGASSSVRWRCNSPTTRTPRTPSSSSFSPARSCTSA